jgi:hypothetical protein
MQRFGNITETVKIELQGMKYCVIQLCGGDWIWSLNIHWRSE